MIILDTNVISEAMRPAPNPQVMNWLEKQTLATLATTAISIAEIRYGLLRLPDGQRKVSLLERFERFVILGFGQRVFPFDLASAEAYGIILVSCEQQGRPVATFDCMIAAIAQVQGAAVATRNMADFENLGVELLNPWLLSA